MKSRITKTALALLLLTSAIFTGCKKDDDNGNNDSLSISKENLAATYTLSSIKIKATGYPESDATGTFIDACEKDDQLILKSDLTYEIKDMGTQCSPTSADTGAWAISGTKITIDGDESTVKSLTKGTLVLEDTYTQNNVTWTVTTTMNRK